MKKLFALFLIALPMAMYATDEKMPVAASATATDVQTLRVENAKLLVDIASLKVLYLETQDRLTQAQKALVKEEQASAEQAVKDEEAKLPKPAAKKDEKK